MGRAFVVLSLMLLTCGLARGGEPVESVGGRVVRHFDFEERDEGNYEPLPMGWSRVVGPGLPHYCRGRLVADLAAGGHSFNLVVDGGSVMYRLDAGTLAAVPGARYRVRGLARTTPLAHARARLGAYLVDANGAMLPGTLRHAPPVAAETWTPLTLELPPPTDPELARRVAGVVVEIGLLQPALLSEKTQAGFAQDVRGQAWFDDVTVSRVPAVRLTSLAAGNVFPRGTPVRFGAVVDDATLGDLTATVSVSDADGRPVARAAGRFAATPGADDHTARVDFALPALAAGWYEASFTVQGEAGRDDLQPAPAATTRAMSFVVLADDDAVPAPRDARVTLDASHLPPGAWADLPTLLNSLGAGRAKLAVWSRDRAAEADPRVLDAAARDLAAAGVLVTGVLAEPPEDLDLETWGELPISGPAAEAWRSALSYLLSRHGRRVDRWQVGRDDDAERFAADPRWFAAYDAIASAAGDLVGRSRVALPWPARAGLSAGALPPSLSLRVGADVLPAQVPLYADEVLRRGGGAGLSLSLNAADPAVYGRIEAASDLARRLTLALAAGADSVTLPLPLDEVEVGGDQSGIEAQVDGLRTPRQPRESYLIQRTLLRNLAGRSYQGRVPAGPGVEAYLFAANDERPGVLVIWDDRAGPTPREATLPMNLADAGASQIDLWGNAAPLTQSESERRAGRARLRVGRVPTMVVGVDAGLTRLRAGVRVDRPTLESSFEPHARRLSFANPFAGTIHGRVRLSGPEGWELDWADAGGVFQLRPGEAFDRPFTLRFPYHSFAGEKTMAAEITLREEGVGGPGREKTIAVPLTLRLGLEDVGLRTAAWVEGGDVVVEQTVTNHGPRPLAYTGFVAMPGQPRQERLVLGVEPGRSASRVYRFAGAASVLGGGAVEVRSGLRELEGTRVLNDRVELR